MPKFTIPDNASALDVLAALDEWGRTVDGLDHWHPFRQQREYLWRVLTAQRGPDNEDDALKDRYTAVVREHSLPHLARLAGAIVNRDPALTLRNLLDEPLEPEWDHFKHHARSAARVLLQF